MYIQVMFLLTLWNYIATIWNFFFESVCFTGCYFESLRKGSVLLIAVSISSLHVKLKKRGGGGVG